MKLRFLLNPTTGEPHIRDHEIQEWEVRDVLEQFVENVAARDGSRAALGQTRNGRWLRVIYRQDPESNPLFVITAYEPSNNAIRAARRGLRRKR